MFFDLPTETPQQRREYARFRKHLLKSGFLMMQESVYCKITLNATAVNSVYSGLQKKQTVKRLNTSLACYRKAVFKNGFYFR